MSLDLFWQRQCHARGFGLTHHRGPDGSDQCVHCGHRPPSDATGIMPPVDVAARLASLGIRNGTEHKDDDFVEPRAITGHGPQGSPEGRGRGPLTEADEDRLIWCCVVARPWATLEP